MPLRGSRPGIPAGASIAPMPTDMPPELHPDLDVMARSGRRKPASAEMGGWADAGQEIEIPPVIRRSATPIGDGRWSPAVSPLSDRIESSPIANRVEIAMSGY